MTEQRMLIAYAMHFASFLIDSRLGKHIKNIILFGSVARGDFTKESDIDLFIDTDDALENEVESMLTLFQSSKISAVWKQKGVEQEISLKVGDLAEWPLQREIISSGILLFGKYAQMPDGVAYHLLISIDVSNKSIPKQVQIWRALYGYKQKAGSKVYIHKGLLSEAGGKKLGKGIVIVPMGQRKGIIEFLRQKKILHQVHEVWSDTL